MNLFTWNVLLALVWAATTEEFSASNLAIGYLLGYALLWVLRSVVQQFKYFRDVYDIIALIIFFIVELILANLRMAYYTLMPLSRMRPAVIAVPLEPMNETELTVLANLITLTPGTLTLDISDDRRIMYIHIMRLYDLEQAKRDIKRGFEERVLKALR
jgi:multicomponent Na+:H+ antiporter subunit E